MAQEHRNRIVEWYELLRAQIPAVRERLALWWAAVQEEPRLIWQTPTVRYGTYVGAGLLVLWIVSLIPSLFGPPVPKDARPAATTADFHVVCSDPACGHHFVIHRRFGFRKFPVECARCKKRTGEQGRACFSDTCRGRWVAPQKDAAGWRCPHCGERFE